MGISVPKEHIYIVDVNGERVDQDVLMDSFKDDDPRVLVNDEIGKVVYLADLDYYYVTPLPNGDQIRQKITQLGSSRFGTNLVRHQIGGKVISTTGDSVFHVKNGDHFIKVRAEKLKAGMILESGEKVHW